MEKLLLEIGTEEIPAGYIAPALEALAAELLKQLDMARITHGRADTFGTPRRLAVTVESVADRQLPLSEEVFGPPAKIAFDAQGQPTMAAKKFAEKVKLAVNRLIVKETPRGRYLCARRTERGLASMTLLRGILPRIILAAPFPKTMKWGDLQIRFARPIHSLLALWGERVISFHLGDIRSGRYTRGHSFMDPGRIKLARAEDYLDRLASAGVMADIRKRRAAVAEDISRTAAAVGGRVLSDEGLLDIVTNLVEAPFAIAGRFDTEFLELPDEVLITAMREHQKYFAVIDDRQRLMPVFIAVNNTRARDMQLVARGHERVIRARLADAQFFFRADLEESLDARCEKLKGVLFHARLGTVYDKVVRVQALAGNLTAEICCSADFEESCRDLSDKVSRAAWLSKSDLVSQMVGEFPKLQGVMGRIYALRAGEDAEIAAAIEEHYRPTYSGGLLPQTLTGAVCSIADKLDSICGFFRVGLVPTGGADPYALRRQGIGLVQIMRDQGFSFSLSKMIAYALSSFPDAESASVDEIAGQVTTFLARRMAHLLAEEGFAKDVIAAVIGISADCVPDVWQRVEVLQKLKAAQDFEPLAASFKRVVNIIRKAGERCETAVRAELFQDAAENRLYDAFRQVQEKVSAAMAAGDFEGALMHVASLRPRVDAFFDAVMVMADDPVLRANRLALLGGIAALFARFADFSKIST